MKRFPDNWDSMSVIQQHQWLKKNSDAVMNKQDKKEPTVEKIVAPVIELPENWDSMGVIERDQFLRNQNRQKLVENKKESIKQPVENEKPDSLQNQYFYYSTMIKSDDMSLKNIPDHSERNKLKPVFINKYREYLEEYMAAKETHDNNVLFNCMVWACDVEQWDWAIELCDYAIETQQKQPENWRRSHVEIVADAAFKACEKVFKSGEKMPKLWLDIFNRLIEKQWLIDDDLFARYLKIEGEIIKETEPQKALEYFKRAQDLKPDIGVKGRIKELEKTV